MADARGTRGSSPARRLAWPLALLTVALLLGAALAAWVAQRGDEVGAPPVVVNVALDATPAAAGSPGAVPAGAATPDAAPSPAATPGGAAEPSATPEASPTVAGAAATAEPGTPATPAASPTPPLPAAIELRPAVAGTGEAMLVSVRAPGAASATLRFRGESMPLVADGELFWAVVGVPVTAEPGAETLSIETRAASSAVLATLERSYEVVLVERPIDYLTLSEELVRGVLTPEAGAEELRLRALQFSAFDPARRWRGTFRQPVGGIVTTEFGQARSTNGGPVGSHHSGLDIANALGTPVIASAPGRVAWAGEMPIRGISVLIDHGAGVVSGYHHLDSAIVEAGEIVEAGSVIGELGSTGLSTGPHLHWELTVWGINVDPVTWTERDFTP